MKRYGTNSYPCAFARLTVYSGRLDMFLFDGGDIDVSYDGTTPTFSYRWYLRDPLGSVRVARDGSGTVRQRFDYYPYGTVSRAWTSSATTDDSEKRYRFGGKEVAGSVLTDLAGEGVAPGAPYLDFGARLYDPRTAAWLSQDPMAEKYYPIGPYVYCAGNPVNLVDLGGLSIRALGINAIDTFLNMLSDEELQYISFDSNGVLNNCPLPPNSEQ